VTCIDCGGEIVQGKTRPRKRCTACSPPQIGLKAAAHFQRVCVVCGAPFMGSLKQKTCSKACLLKRLSKAATLQNAPVLAAARAKRRRPCLWCGAIIDRPIKARRPGRSRHEQFCGKSCAMKSLRAQQILDPLRQQQRARQLIERAAAEEAHRQQTWPTCKECGAKADGYASRFCSDACRRVNGNRQSAEHQRKVRPAPPPRDCRACGCAIPIVRVKGIGARRYCSLTCYKRSDAYKRCRRQAKARRKAHLRGASCLHVFDPIEVFKRDGWRCQLCGTPTPRRLRGRMAPNAPELDHITPLARGGAHSVDNAQCLCRRCNGAKGARVMGQLRISLDVAVG
jgi:5-methylcytosine-specific restriction endonuclease McrA